MKWPILYRCTHGGYKSFRGTYRQQMVRVKAEQIKLCPSCQATQDTSPQAR